MKKLNREELIILVQRIMDVDGTEEEIDQMMDTLEANVIHPEVSDLIFYSKKEDPAAEEIVDEALAYKPIILGP